MLRVVGGVWRNVTNTSAQSRREGHCSPVNLRQSHVADMHDYPDGGPVTWHFWARTAIHAPITICTTGSAYTMIVYLQWFICVAFTGQSSSNIIIDISRRG